MPEIIWDVEKEPLCICHLDKYIHLSKGKSIILKNVEPRDLQRILIAFDVYHTLGADAKKLIKLLEEKKGD
jgi:hypothetical protein